MEEARKTVEIGNSNSLGASFPYVLECLLNIKIENLRLVSYLLQAIVLENLFVSLQQHVKQAQSREREIRISLVLVHNFSSPKNQNQLAMKAQNAPKHSAERNHEQFPPSQST